MKELMVQPALDEAMKDVLERMFFIEATNGASAEPPGANPTVEARLTFEGQPPGSLRLCVPADAARAISADFLGVDPIAVSSPQVGEVVCELANMICGSVLSRVEKSATFRLSTPTIITGELPVAEGARVTRHSLETPIGVFTAILTTEGSAWAPAEFEY